MTTPVDKFEFEVVLEEDSGGKLWYRAELVGSAPTTPYGYGESAWEAIVDLCETMHEQGD